MKKNTVVSVFIGLALNAVAAEYRYGFDSYPRSASSGTLNDGELTFYREPLVVPSPFDANGAGAEDWALYLDRDLKQYAATDECQSFTGFNGSCRVELFFRPDGLSDLNGTVFDTRQGLIYVGNPTLLWMLITQRNLTTGVVSLGVSLRLSDGTAVNRYAVDPILLNRWYHAEVVVTDRGDDGQPTDEVVVWLDGQEVIRIEDVALNYMDALGRFRIGYGASEDRTFQGAIDEVLISSNLTENSLLVDLPGAQNVLQRTARMEISTSNAVPCIRYTAPVGGEHRIFLTDTLSATNWIDAGALVVDDGWSGQWCDTDTNQICRFYRIETTPQTESVVPTVEDILSSGAPEFDPWNTTRWAAWYEGDKLIKPFDISSDITMDTSVGTWEPDLSDFPENRSLFELTAPHPVSIEGNGLIVDARFPELAAMSLEDLYDLQSTEVSGLFPVAVGGIIFNQQTGASVTSRVSGLTLRGFSKALECNHYNLMAGVITNCVFEYNRWAFFPRGSAPFCAEDNLIRANLFGGVYAEYSSSNWTFRKNTFHDNNMVGVWSWGDMVLDACYGHTVEDNSFAGASFPPKDYHVAVSLYRNRGEAGDIREYASMNHQIRSNQIAGYHVGIDVAVRAARDSLGNDLSQEARCYSYDNTFARNVISNCVIGIHLLGDRNTVASNQYDAVEREVVVHSPFYKNEGTVFDGEEGTEVWFWGDAAEDYAAYAAYVPHQNRVERHIEQSNRWFFVSTRNGAPAFQNAAGKNVVTEQTLLIGNSLREACSNGGVIRQAVAADFAPNLPGSEFAVIWNQPVSRISAQADGYTTFTDYYSIIIYDQSGKEIDRCGRSTLRWDSIAAGNFIDGVGHIHSDAEAEMAAVHSAPEGGTYPLYIFRKGFAEPAAVLQTNAVLPALDLAAERPDGTDRVSLAVLRGLDVALVTPANETEVPFCTLSNSPLSMAMGELNQNESDGCELAVLYSNSVAVYQVGEAVPLATAGGEWSALAAGEFDGDDATGDELVLASTIATNGLYPLVYIDHALTNVFRTLEHSVLQVPALALSAGPVSPGVGPDGTLRRGDGRNSLCYEFQPRFEFENTGFAEEGDLAQTTAAGSFVASPFDFDGDGDLSDEQAASLSYSQTQFFPVDDPTEFFTPDGSYTVEAFFKAASLPAVDALAANMRRGIFCWYNGHINGSLYLYRSGDSLRLQALVRNDSATFSTATVTAAAGLTVGQWYHVMLKVIDQGDDELTNDRIELYLNGSMAGSADQLDVEFFQSGTLMRVGHSVSSGYRSFDGLLDGVRLSAGVDSTSLLDEIPNARGVLELTPNPKNNSDQVLVLPGQNDSSLLYWMQADGTSQELRAVPVLR